MPNKAKNSTFYQIFKFLTLFGMLLQKLAKTHKNEKIQHPMGCFTSKKQFKINFLNFCLFLAYFEQKSGKKRVFCDFLKNGDFWSKFNITNVFLVKFPF